MKVDAKSRQRTKAGGNVFRDLGFPPAEARRLLAQADAGINEAKRLKKQLMDEIASWMKDERLTQATAAQLLQVTRPRVSDVVNHKVGKFTLDALVAMLACAGKQVRLEVGPSRGRGAEQAGLVQWSGRRLRPRKPLAKVKGGNTVSQVLVEDRG